MASIKGALINILYRNNLSSFEPTENYHPTLQLVLPFSLFWITVHKNKSMIAAFKGTVQHKDEKNTFFLSPVVL